ncbi:MAG: FRG domain-containing protein [Desulfobacteraceae bacterium]|nr:FRG domain-containing protein [Deltaproteobacteria bacterium]MBL6979398.1 FRG domain-containing protein [Desulfobacteraceae bacterium]MBL7218372.1 FRG domain-containing protein [Desulfobacteraceae bacterium]
MEIKHLNSWLEFKDELAKLQTYRKSLSNKSGREMPPILFRGHQNSCWELRTTFERYTGKDEIPALEYYEMANTILPNISNHSDKGCYLNLEGVREWAKMLRSAFLYSLPSREYMTYLRHYGFPSPLLDWTKDHYIAAFFAFRDVLDMTRRVAIYAYIDYIGIGKTIEGSGPVILTVPENDLFPERHLRQKSCYTSCLIDTSFGVTFSSHENAFPKSDSDENLLWKFTLPTSEKISILHELDEMGINSYKLFNTEDTLMETLALRTFR